MKYRRGSPFDAHFVSKSEPFLGKTRMHPRTRSRPYPRPYALNFQLPF